jgi:hypothetical protein
MFEIIDICEFRARSCATTVPGSYLSTACDQRIPVVDTNPRAEIVLRMHLVVWTEADATFFQIACLQPQIVRNIKQELKDCFGLLERYKMKEPPKAFPPRVCSK